MSGINDVAAAVGKQSQQGFVGEFGVSINSPDPSVYHSGMVSGSNSDPSFAAIGSPGPPPARIGAVVIPSRNYRKPDWVNDPSEVIVNPGMADGLFGTTPTPAAPAAPAPPPAPAPTPVMVQAQAPAAAGGSSRFSLGQPTGPSAGSRIRDKFASPAPGGAPPPAAVAGPANPSAKVRFDLPGFGEMEAWYHNVIYQKAPSDNAPSLLVLVTDTRFQGPSYFPPISAEKIGVGYGRTEFLVHSPGILYNCGNDRHCVLLVEAINVEE